MKAVDSMLALAEDGDDGSRINQLRQEEVVPANDAYQAVMDEFGRESDRVLAEVHADQESMNQRATVLLVSFVLLLIVIAGGAMTFLTRHVLKPLEKANEHFDRIASGDLTQRIVAKTQNEIGQLFQSLARMQEGLTGTVAHAWLERLGGAQDWDAARIAQQTDVVRRQLSRAGLPAASLDAGVDIVMDTLTKMLSSARGRWLLGLSQARREWALLDAQGRVSVIDLAVQDAEGWLVVDYKTNVPHPQEARGDFSQRMRARHAEQLWRYCAQVTALDGRPARAALYFPRVDVWVECDGAALS